MKKNIVKWNHITLGAVKNIAKAVKEQGHHITVEYLTENGTPFQKGGKPCTHVAITIRRAEYEAIESDPWYSGGLSNISSFGLREIYNHSSEEDWVDFDFGMLEDMTDPEKYAEEVEKKGTANPYYRWLPYRHLRLAFKLVEDAVEI